MAVTADDIVTRFPAFEGQEERIELLLEEAVVMVGENWGDSRDIAIKYWVAHMLVSEDSADSLPVTSESLGPISVSYAAPKEGSDPFDRTEYGRRFKSMRKGLFGGPLVIRGTGAI